MSTDKHEYGCPICSGDDGIPTSRFYKQYGRFFCPDCGATNLLHWRLDPDGVQIYPASDGAQQWVQQSCKCPACGHTWQAVAPLGSAGIECPKCHEVDLSFVWKER